MIEKIIGIIIIIILIGIVIRLVYLINQLKEERKLAVSVYRQEALKQCEGKLEALNKSIEEKKAFNESLLKMREDELNRLMDEKKANAVTRVASEIEDWQKSAQEAAAFNSRQYMTYLNGLMCEMENNYQELKGEVEDYRKQRDTINQDILRARMVEELEDFYRIQLSEESRHDLKLIDEIRSQFSKIDLLDKLLYDNYIKKPVEEMEKRVLGGRAPCGIYKITRLRTGEIYIGKSTDVKARWTQHAKSCYHCGTISQSVLHTTMQKDGIENFTWELLEEVPKEKLSEREKFWIQFYDTKKYGLNEKEG